MKRKGGRAKHFQLNLVHFMATAVRSSSASSFCCKIAKMQKTRRAHS